jgi:N-acetylmuramoyl-L-alanine amidase
MNKRLIWITVCLILTLFTALQVKNRLETQETFSKNAVHYGATGSDVYELQGRLKFLGFYKGSVDGDFGYQTLTAVKRFQSQFGMNVDGIVGSKTKVKLWEATKNWRPSAAESPPAGNGQPPSAAGNRGTGNLKPASRLGYSNEDLQIMANAVNGEARGEPYEGQVAVAAVILNRVKSSSFPNTVHGVIFQPGAFTAVADGQIYLTPNESSKRAVLDAINGIDPSGGCLYYFNPKTATSKWIWTRPQVKTIGQHIFCM